MLYRAALLLLVLWLSSSAGLSPPCLNKFRFSWLRSRNLFTPFSDQAPLYMLQSKIACEELDPMADMLRFAPEILAHMEFPSDIYLGSDNNGGGERSISHICIQFDLSLSVHCPHLSDWFLILRLAHESSVALWISHSRLADNRTGSVMYRSSGVLAINRIARSCFLCSARYEGNCSLFPTLYEFCHSAPLFRNSIDPFVTVARGPRPSLPKSSRQVQ